MAERPFASQVARSLLYSGAGNVVSKGINVIAILVVLKLLTPEEFGMAALVLALFAIVQAVTDLGLGAALVQAHAPTRRQTDGLFWLSLLASGAMYAVLFVAAPFVAEFYDMPELSGMVRVFGLVIVMFAFYFVPRNLLIRELAFDRIVIIDNGALLASGLAMIVFAYFGFGAWAIILGELSARVVMLLGYQLLHPYLPGWRFRFGEVKPLVVFGAYATGSRLLYNFYTNVDYLIVGRIFGAEIVGLYTLAYRIVIDPVKTLTSVVNDVSFPALSRLQDDVARLRRYFLALSRGTMMAVGVVLLTIVLYIDLILTLGGFEQWLPALPLIYVLALFGVVRSVAAIVPPLLNSVGRIDQTMLFSLLGSAVMPMAFVIGAQFGPLGVAWAWVVAYPLVFALLLVFAARVVEMGPLRFTLKSFAGARLLTVFAGGALLLRFLLDRLADWPPLVVAPLGVVITLSGGLLLLYWREREVVALLRGKSKATAS